MEKTEGDSLKVDEDKFKAAIRALLNTPPTPMSDLPKKREPKTKKRAGKKRG